MIVARLVPYHLVLLVDMMEEDLDHTISEALLRDANPGREMAIATRTCLTLALQAHGSRHHLLRGADIPCLTRPPIGRMALAAAARPGHPT